MDEDRRRQIDQAVGLKKKRELGEAIRLLEGLVAEDRADAYAAGHLAHALVLRGRPREGLELADQILLQNPGNAFALSVRGDALLRLRRYEEAREPLEQALATTFRSAWLYGRAAEARLRSGDPDGARRHLERGLEEFPGEGKLLLALGRLERASGDAEVAERHIEEAARRMPGDGFAYKEMIAGRARSRGKEVAITELRRLLKIPSQAQNPHLHDELGRLLTETRDYEGALTEARRAHELAPGNRLLHARLAWALIKAKQDREAIDELQACLDNTPEDPQLNRSYLAARRRLGQLDEAHAFYLTLLRRHPEARKIYGWLRKVAREAESAYEGEE